MNISIEQTNNLFSKLTSLQQSSSPTSEEDSNSNNSDNNKNNKNNEINLPSEIDDAIKAILDAQKIFIKAVDRFVHNVDDISKADVIKDIIDTCPQFLTSRNKHGLLPIHTACFRDSCSVYVPLFANAGVVYGVGGADGRGGLLEETSKGNNTFELLAGSTDAIYENDKCLVDTMKVLMNEKEEKQLQLQKKQHHQHQPLLYPPKPLLYRGELYQAGFLLKALTNERVAMTKFLIDFDPLKLYGSVLDDNDIKQRLQQQTQQGRQRRPNAAITSGTIADEDKCVGTWPIHIACNNGEMNNGNINTDDRTKNSNYKLFCFLLQRGMKHRSLVTRKGLDDYLGGLFAKDSRTNESTFELAMKAFGEEKTWSCILSYIPSSSTMTKNNNNFHILQRAVKLPLKYLSGFVNRYPRAYFARDNNGSLPIHHALKEGMEWSTELISIINANINSLQKPDPCYNLHPFALAAAGPKYDLSSIFYMLSLHPEHIGGSGGTGSDEEILISKSLAADDYDYSSSSSRNDVRDLSDDVLESGGNDDNNNQNDGDDDNGGGNMIEAESLVNLRFF
jgi:hypothetical protein